MKKIIVVIFVVSNFVLKAQYIVTIAGVGLLGYSGDTGLATLAKLHLPGNVITDNNGNIIIADSWGHRIRKVNATTSIITTIAGTGIGGYNGDNILATSAMLFDPVGLAIDSFGNIYIGEGSYRVRKIDQNGIITTFAGNGIDTSLGDGLIATNASLKSPGYICFDKNGDLLISDARSHNIRKVNHITNIITTVAGNGIMGYNGDGIIATNAQLHYPQGIAVDENNNIYISDLYNGRIRKVNNLGTIITVVGTGVFGYNGDGGLADTSLINGPYAIIFDANNRMYISEFPGNRVRKIDISGIIHTIAGNGIGAYNGDSILAISAEINEPTGLHFDLCNNLLIADGGNNRIRKVWFNTDTIPQVSATITPNDTVITGTQVNTTASATNHGTITSYQWVKNGAISSTSSAYTYTPVNGDSVYCIVTVRACTGRMYTDTTTAIHITVTGDAGITKIANYNTYTYPNPVTDVLHVATTEAQQYVMHNLMGVAILQGAISKNNIIDMKAIPAGLYLLQLTNAEGKREVVRVVKE